MAFDLSNVETADTSSFTPIPEGVYPFRVTDGCEKKRDDKPPQHEFEVTVQHGKHEGRKFKVWFTLSEGHAPFLKLFYESMGATADELKDVSPDKFIGRAFRAEVEVKEYNSKLNNGLKIGQYFQWDGKENSAWGADDPPPQAETSPSKNKEGSPFGEEKTASIDDEPPF